MQNKNGLLKLKYQRITPDAVLKASGPRAAQEQSAVGRLMGDVVVLGTREMNHEVSSGMEQLEAEYKKKRVRNRETYSRTKDCGVG